MFFDRPRLSIVAPDCLCWSGQRHAVASIGLQFSMSCRSRRLHGRPHEMVLRAAPSVIAAAYDCLLPAGWHGSAWHWLGSVSQACERNSGALAFGQFWVQLGLVIFPLLYWCCSIIARENEQTSARPESAPQNGDQFAEASVLLAASNAVSYAVRKRTADPEQEPLVLASSPRCSNPDAQGLQSCAPKSSKLCQDIRCLHQRRWRRVQLAEDALTLVPMLYLHFSVMRRTIALMSWPVLFFGPALGWTLPLFGAFMAWRFSGAVKLAPR
jgi:hypothetical protein